MTDIKKTNHNVRFFANNCLSEQIQKQDEAKDPTPFGLNFQESFPDFEKMAIANGFTFAQSPTQTPTGIDGCADIDVQV